MVIWASAMCHASFPLLTVQLCRYGLQGLQELTALFEAGKLSAQIAKTFSLADAALAFNFSKGGGEGGVSSDHFGKIAIVP